ncbi:hypothetical protein KDA_58590 [Dictyobacter alpinus]|uniref:Uncharacterized protein n=1 Tax=Dictyobacter alpinus TaxID=2014873 RepID=A0A402BG67_9CHLR|nr:hypothetical protein KDA_58590 [Dictyobacter alpinus]
MWDWISRVVTSMGNRRTSRKAGKESHYVLLTLLIMQRKEERYDHGETATANGHHGPSR